MHLPTLLCLIFYLSYVWCESACSNHKSCGECIGHASQRCIWCSQAQIPANQSQSRCQPEKYLHKSSWCTKDFIQNPKSNYTIQQNANFSSTVQIRPQEIKIKARPGVFVSFNVSYASAEDFPLDVYFLMDYSYTMKNHSEMLKEGAIDIYEGLRKLTKNVQLGVGSFIEKPGLPFADTIVANQTTYVFKNHLSLTTKMESFKNVITNSVFGSNYDDPEAGLDALMQVMMCKSQLGWRNNTRRIIVLATDSSYHSAGDGKFLGAIKPNDMKCNLVGNEYDRKHALIYDYPSVGQINKAASDGNYIIIFAALQKVKFEYETLATKILGAKYAELKENSNIVKIIKDAYDESVGQVKLHHTSLPAVQVKIGQDCQSRPRINCERSPRNPIVTIPVSIKSTNCTKSGPTDNSLTIGIVGLHEKLKISIEVDCECECEKNVLNVTSAQCNDNGNLQCGACKCNENRGGDSCEFNCSDAVVKDSSKCFEPNSTTECNGHGECRCGKCECYEERFSGEFCQYHDGLCPHINNKVCAGNGDCRYGLCDCDTHWSGPGCDCTELTEKCFGPFTAKVCSGKGTCKCGECACEIVEGTQYLGPFCDSCEDCANERCEELKDYAHCNVLEEKDNCDRKFNQTDNKIEVNLVNKTEFNADLGTATKCKTELANGTFLLFKYEVDPTTRGLLLTIQNEVELPSKANIWITIGSAIAGILLIGLLTVIMWKILTAMYDKREYEKFCNEAKAQGYDVSQNPLYEPPTQNFVNPGFIQQSI